MCFFCLGGTGRPALSIFGRVSCSFPKAIPLLEAAASSSDRVTVRPLPAASSSDRMETPPASGGEWRRTAAKAQPAAFHHSEVWPTGRSIDSQSCRSIEGVPCRACRSVVGWVCCRRCVGQPLSSLVWSRAARHRSFFALAPCLYLPPHAHTTHPYTPKNSNTTPP